MVPMMDSNKNENYCCSGNGIDGFGGGSGSELGVRPAVATKAATAAKYQNQFNNNNHIEQENLMPSTMPATLAAKDGAVTVAKQNGTTTAVPQSVRDGDSECAVRALPIISSHSRPIPESPLRQQQNAECLNASRFTNGSRHELATSPNAISSENDQSGSSVSAAGTGPTATVARTVPKAADPTPGAEPGASQGEDSSDTNSIGNLSYISESGLIEEIIFLPNNGYSDEDNASASDDCIYAYRGGEQGGGQLLELRGDQPDDETDFLEMDFDPEPSSELENFIEHHDIVGSSYPVPLRPTEAAREATGRSPQPLPEDLLNEGAVRKSPQFTAPANVEPVKENVADDVQVSEVVDVKQQQARKTGAIPKNFTSLHGSDVAQSPGRPQGRGNTKNLKLDLNMCTHVGDNGKHRYQQYPCYKPSEYPSVGSTSVDELDRLTAEDEENSCLDCTEKEFLMKTKQDLNMQRVCKTCYAKRKSGSGPAWKQPPTDVQPEAEYFKDEGTVEPPLNTSSSETSEDLMNARAEQIVLQALNKVNELKATPPSVGLSRSMEDICDRIDLEDEGQNETETQEQQSLADTEFLQEDDPEKTVTIYTINCGELTILEALTRIGITPNMDVLRQYFREQYEVDTAKMSVPQYLLHMSKRDCNFKKLTEAIKNSCDEALDIQYYPLDPFSEFPEVVQISSAEIAKRWNANTNLRQIIHFKHKHFHTLNVLGKIVNILRQPSRGRNTNHMINIPQYYKSGSLTITRVVS